MTVVNGGTSRLDYATPRTGTAGQQMLFWGCFIALVTTAFGFIARMFLINTWAAEFGLDPAQAGRLAGIGIWPFAASIIFFSLVIDKIGYKVSMIIAFLGHIIWAVMGVSAFYVARGGNKETAYFLLYWGSLILALGNGTVEAFINPVVATLFSREKTKWLNILHAGWPGGLVVAGVIAIALGDRVNWGIKVGIIALPAVVYFLMLIGARFPAQERVTAGVSYREMVAEFGILGALIVGFLVTLQLMDFFVTIPTFAENGDPSQGLALWAKLLFAAIGAVIVLGFAAYSRSLGRPLLFFLVLIMIPLATTEIGTDGWITGIMAGVLSGTRIDPGWVLVYTSLIMMILRFFAGPIVHSLSPLGLLAVSAFLAIIGLACLSISTGLAMIFLAATVYALGKTFFWPTMLGVVSEQTPRGGALTLNAISGIGMLAVGTLGFPFIGALQAGKQIDAVASTPELRDVPAVVSDGRLTTVQQREIYEVIPYETVDDQKLNAAIAQLPSDRQAEVTAKIREGREKSNQKALLNMALFPCIMLAGYLILIVYFKGRGGYKAVHLDADGGASERPANANDALRDSARGAQEY